MLEIEQSKLLYKQYLAEETHTRKSSNLPSVRVADDSWIFKTLRLVIVRTQKCEFISRKIIHV